MAPPKTALINGYLQKMKDPDADFRFMALSDLTNSSAADPALFGADEALEATAIKDVLGLVEDKNSEVKNQAVKCVGQLIKHIRESQMNIVVDKLIEFSTSTDDELRDVAGLALKTVTSELPLDGKIAEKACAKLAPKLLTQLQNPATPPETAIETLAILSILVTRFPIYLADIHPSAVVTFTPLLNHSRPAVRKRTVLALAQFLPTASQQIFATLLKSDIQPSLASSTPLERQRTIIQLVGASARYAPLQISAFLEDLVPGVLAATDRDDGELREGCLQALETIVLRCPSEVTPYLNSILAVGDHLIKYDPNYADNDEDEEMEDAEDEDDEELGDDYSDDEDTSYKVRRSAAKLLAAVIGTRPELLTTLFRTVSPVLISRFGDREESVRLEIWATYFLLLKQIGLYGGAPQARDVEGLVGVKRKREEEGMDVEETPHSLLHTQTPLLSKALLKQLTPKTPPNALQAGFGLLLSLLQVAPGSLSGQVALVTTVTSSVLNQSSSATVASLHVSVLSFLNLFFYTHSPVVFSPSLTSLTPPLLRSIAEKDPRISSEGFRAFSTLLSALKPLRSSDWAERVYQEAVQRLERHDTDVAVRRQAEECITELWLCATELARAQNGAEWTALRKSGRTEGAVKVIQRVASEVDVSQEWLAESVQWVLEVVKKSARSQKDDALVCLQTLLSKYSTGYPQGLVPTVITQMRPYLRLAELSHLAHSLNVISVLLRFSPKETYPLVESEILASIYPCAISSLVTGNTLEALVAFFVALVQADSAIAGHVIPGLSIALDKTGAAGSSVNVSRCIGAVISSEVSLAAGTISDFSKSIKKNSKATVPRVVLSLRVLGEIGRFVDMAIQDEVFNNSLALFASDSEDIRAAAAFAVGNIAIGNIPVFLPVLVKQVKSDSDKRLLSLHALKEVVTHCPHHNLEGVADAIWLPLFDNPENSEENTRNVAAACLGKLTTTNPSRYLPQLQSRLRDESPEIRAVVVSAIRYTFADTAQSYDELLSPLIVDFLSLVTDANLNVRRLSLASLNAAARNKPHLIKDHLSTIMPSLYAETVINRDLIRTVDMGPWKHRVDDGLEARKTAYETMYTLLDTCLSQIDLQEFFTHVLTGLSDDADEVKVLCHMMLFRLSQVAPTAVAQRLDEASPELEETVKATEVTKDTVKQDLERAGELQRSALRAIAALSKISSPNVSPRMERLVDTIEKGPMAHEFRDLL